MSRDVLQLLSPDDEALVLGLIEGTLSEAQQRDAALLVASRPGLAAVVARLRNDRTAITIMDDDEDAPQGLADSAIAKFETMPALRPLDYTPQESSVRVVAERPPFVWTRAHTRLAAAVAIAGLSVAVWSAWPPARPSSVGEGTGGEIAENTQEPVHDRVPFEDGGAYAANGEPPDRPVVFPRNDAGVIDDGTAIAANTPGEDGGSALVPLAVSELSDSELVRALELARSGRLVVRVVARTPSRAEDQIGVLALRRGPTRHWTLDTKPPEALALALRSGGELTIPQRERFLPMIAGEMNIPLPAAAGNEGPEALPEPRRHAVCVATMTPTAESLKALRDSLARDVGTVELGVARGPLPGVAPVSTAEDVLWWTLPTTRWVEQMSVPVIVEMW